MSDEELPYEDPNEGLTKSEVALRQMLADILCHGLPRGNPYMHPSIQKALKAIAKDRDMLADDDWALALDDYK